MSITIEPVIFANDAHLSQWYTIRSEKSVREACRSVKKITPEQHRIWWDESAKSKDRLLYFIRVRRDPALPTVTPPGHVPPIMVQTVGILRVDHRGSWTEVWLAVKPDHRQYGFATETLLVLSQIAAQLKWPPLGAVVHGRKNIASWRLFTRAGFVMQHSGFLQLVQPRTST